MSSSLDLAAGVSTPAAPARWIDPRGQRFGAGFSAAVLALAVAADSLWLAAAIGLALAVSSSFGTRWFVFGRPWPLIRSVLRLAPVEPEHEYPPRFAQALGAIFVGIGSLLLVVGLTPWGWIPILGVVALQVVLAATGYCLGCRLYFVRWYIPALFTRLIRRSAA
jgi:hypothetical protein